MMKLFAYFLQNLKNEKGQSMVEYGLVLGLVAIVAVAVLTQIGEGLQETFQEIADTITNTDSWGRVEVGNK